MYKLFFDVNKALDFAAEISRELETDEVEIIEIRSTYQEYDYISWEVLASKSGKHWEVRWHKEQRHHHRRLEQ